MVKSPARSWKSTDKYRTQSTIPMTSGDHLPVGTVIDKYRIVRVLGIGGFGITYLGHDDQLQRDIAIKECFPFDICVRNRDGRVVARTRDDEETLTWARTRFVDEAKLLASMHHPNIVSVYDYFKANGTAYMINSYEPGINLQQALESSNRRYSESDLHKLIDPILDALKLVHSKGVLHRDIKPDNIYLCDSGRPILLDFGAAREVIGRKTRAITALLTLGYAPLEQYSQDSSGQGPWTDIYAMGGVIFRIITGEVPIEAARRVRQDSMTKLATNYGQYYDHAFLTAIDSALCIDEEDRPQSIDAWQSRMSKQGIHVGSVPEFKEPDFQFRPKDPTPQKKDILHDSSSNEDSFGCGAWFWIAFLVFIIFRSCS